MLNSCGLCHRSNGGVPARRRVPPAALWRLQAHPGRHAGVRRRVAQLLRRARRGRLPVQARMAGRAAGAARRYALAGPVTPRVRWSGHSGQRLFCTLLCVACCVCTITASAQSASVCLCCAPVSLWQSALFYTAQISGSQFLSGHLGLPLPKTRAPCNGALLATHANH